MPVSHLVFVDPKPTPKLSSDVRSFYCCSLAFFMSLLLSLFLFQLKVSIIYSHPWQVVNQYFWLPKTLLILFPSSSCHCSFCSISVLMPSFFKYVFDNSTSSWEGTLLTQDIVLFLNFLKPVINVFTSIKFNRHINYINWMLLCTTLCAGCWKLPERQQTTYFPEAKGVSEWFPSILKGASSNLSPNTPLFFGKAETCCVLSGVYGEKRGWFRDLVWFKCPRNIRYLPTI